MFGSAGRLTLGRLCLPSEEGHSQLRAIAGKCHFYCHRMIKWCFFPKQKQLCGPPQVDFILATSWSVFMSDNHIWAILKGFHCRLGFCSRQMSGHILVLIPVSFGNGVSIYTERSGAMEMSAFLKTGDIPHGCKYTSIIAPHVGTQNHL